MAKADSLVLHFYNLLIEIKSEKNTLFLRIEFFDKPTLKNLSDHQSQQAKVTDDRLGIKLPVGT